jgi:hypothetical protein
MTSSSGTSGGEPRERFQFRERVHAAPAESTYPGAALTNGMKGATLTR